MQGDEGDETAPSTDYEIAQSVEMEPIWEVVEPFGLDRGDLELYGEYKAKITHDAIDRLAAEGDGDGNLVLVTGMTPTPKGEGKTVTTVGLGQTLNHLGKKTVTAIREPSLGPVFGVKGGAAGGGWSQVLPMEDINLHFTGDIHALTAAHNLIAAMLDAAIYHGTVDVDITEVAWPRALDMNDRELRQTVAGLGGSGNGVPREDGFILTAASELMAVLCLADSLGDLKERVGRIIVAYDDDGEPVTVDDIEATGAVTMLLRDALKPNLVQTIEGNPAFVHGGPFANIAHGTNSLIADHAAFNMGDYVVTEAGFGADLGAEKFLDVVCRFGNFSPDAVVLVVTARALKYHGQNQWPVDYDALEEEDVEAIERGLANPDKHVENLRKFGVPVVVAINRFPGDTDAEIDAIVSHYEDDLGVRAAESNVFGEGSEGGVDLAERVIDAAENDPSDYAPLYDVEDSIQEKIETVATEIYGAASVNYSGDALDDIERMEELGLDDMPIIMSKTFHSLSDDATLKGVPGGWELNITEVYPSAGAGFLVVLTGDVLRMPGLPERPAAADMDIDEDGTISGLF